MAELKEHDLAAHKALQDDIASWQHKFNVLYEEHSKYQADMTAQVHELQKQNRNFDEELKISYNKHIEDNNKQKMLEREVKGKTHLIGLLQPAIPERKLMPTVLGNC